MDDNIMKHILKMMGISEDETQMYGTPIFVPVTPIRERSIKPQKSERQKIQDKLAVLFREINKNWRKNHGT